MTRQERKEAHAKRVQQLASRLRLDLAKAFQDRGNRTMDEVTERWLTDVEQNWTSWVEPGQKADLLDALLQMSGVKRK